MKQRFLEFTALCTRPIVVMAWELVKDGDRERYYRDLYE